MGQDTDEEKRAGEDARDPVLKGRPARVCAGQVGDGEGSGHQSEDEHPRKVDFHADAEQPSNINRSRQYEAPGYASRPVNLSGYNLILRLDCSAVKRNLCNDHTEYAAEHHLKFPHG